MKRIFLLSIIVIFYVQCKPSEKISENKTTPTVSLQNATPKLVIGIVVDQMRYDYLTRFWNQFGKDGFKRLVSEGFTLKNAHYDYVPTYTAPGHTSIYTGASPKTHGIISNSWYSRREGEKIYCVEDDSVNPIGTKSSDGKKSPHRLLAMTVADQNRLHTEMRGKTIGISLKDRSAILPAGHTANAAYWFRGRNEGKFITSSYYINELPKWVKNFNSSDAAEKYLKTWNTLKPIETYVESGADLNNFEHGFDSKKTATFPYNLNDLKQENGGFSILKSTPFGNSLTTDFAIAALDGENLGQDNITDFLAVSFSATDYVGHNFGVNSKEVEDTYIRLDLDLARLLTALDEKVGKGNYTLFLSADHGGGQVPAYLISQQIPSAYFETDALREALHQFMATNYGLDNLILNLSNNQVFFNYEALKENNISRENFQESLLHFLLQYPKIDRVFTRSMLQNTDYIEGIGSFVQNGFNSKRSGDVVYTLQPGAISYSKKGSTHGTAFNYDTHVPVIFYGEGIKPGQTTRYAKVTDIAPTISALLGIAFPNAATGEVLYYILD